MYETKKPKTDCAGRDALLAHAETLARGVRLRSFLFVATVVAGPKRVVLAHLDGHLNLDCAKCVSRD